jgi:hypothetical protein
MSRRRCYALMKTFADANPNKQREKGHQTAENPPRNIVHDSKLRFFHPFTSHVSASAKTMYLTM